MRKSKSSYKSRLLGVGITATTVGAVALLAPTAAWAVAATATPNIVVPNSAVTLENSTYTYGAGHYAQVQAGTACTTRYTAANNTTIWDATQAAGAAHQIVVTVPSSVPAGDRGAAKAYNLCVFDTNNTTSSTQLLNATAYVTTSPTLSTTAGPTGGGNQLTLVSGDAVFTGLSGLGAIFVSSTANCPTTYGTTPPANMFATDATRVSNTQATLTVPTGVTAPNSSVAPVAYNICLFNGTTATSTLLTDANYSVNRIVLNQNSGPSGGNNGLTVQTADPNSTLFATTPGVVLRTATCTGTHYSTAGATTGVVPVPTANLRKLSDNQIAFSVPSDATNLTAGTWNICIYDSTTNGAGNVIASATYVLSPAVTLTKISPAAGTTNGGTRITVYGSNFPLTAGSISASLGGVPLSNIQPNSTGAFYATTPAHSPDNAATLVVTTSTGTVSLQNAFSFQNAISVTPKTAPNTTPTTDVQVTGSGFLNYNFGSSASVYLVDGTYNPANDGSGNKANGPIQECANVLRVSDTLLICTLTLNRRFDETGAVFDPTGYTVALAGGATADVTTKVLTLAAQTVTWKAVGQAITDAGNDQLAPNTIITAVLSPSRILLSNYPIANGATGALTVGGATGAAPVHTITGNATLGVSASVAGGTTLTVVPGSTGAPLTQADVGRVISGAGTSSAIANGTTIVSVAPDGMSATMSAAATGTLTGVTLKLYPAAPVPNGAYTLTVVNDNTLGADTTNANYQQSAVTSGATFTVAPA
ncbi:beta strand repeat-containing protein [Actinoplanes sp. CA-030573]|uniref:beta strand repeat-containing protein n=1 Tax=Actinoplanes sp. CA-030573 TaxID=3239898 RepID=UPI003D90C719